MIDKIYLDMDGVIVDFNKQYDSMYGVIARNDVNIGTNWYNAVSRGVFADAPPMEDAVELLRAVLSTDCEVEILSCISNFDNFKDVAFQKDLWLDEHGLTALKRNYVRLKSEKGAYGKPNTLLIDDSSECIKAFRRNGGKAITHVSAEKTIAKLKEFVS